MNAVLIFGLLLGIGLGAACGFRVFVPLLMITIGVRAGHLELVWGFEWIGSDLALIMLGSATVLEIVAY